VVSVDAAALLDARVASLRATIVRALPLASETSIGFAQAVLSYRSELAQHFGSLAATDLDYGGIPALARAGFLRETSPERVDTEGFKRAVDRLRGRPRGGRDQLRNDDLALLGIASGLSTLACADAVAAERRAWLLDIANEVIDPNAWSHRGRQLAADLLDGSGRLRADPQCSPDMLVIDLVLRHSWPRAFVTVAPIGTSHRQDLMAELLSSAVPADGELERASAWFVALDLLVRRASADLVPDFDVLVETLKATQSALRRWVWDSKPNRNGVGPARWLIDAESHVQAFLWAILEPRFGDQLLDEQYLPGHGQKQPRFDFGLCHLKTIVEVKIARAVGDFSRIEEEVAGDLGLYFSDLARYDKMIVYIYDDSDVPHSERYDTLRSALKQRDHRIGEVIVVQRPGMIPPRGDRAPWTSTKSPISN
jgi:hypothetical protein